MAFGTGTITAATGAVSDLFAASGHSTKAAGDRIEADNYDMASDLALQNSKYTEDSTKIKLAQQDRELTMTIGGQQAGTAGAGLAASGSALSLLADSASQGGLTHAVLQQQGVITEAGYQEQAASYTNMAKAARMAADAEDTASTGSMITGIMKGITAVASIGLAPFTGGASLAVGAGVTAGLDGLDAIH